MNGRIIFEDAKAVLEVCYYAAGVILVFVAYRGLAQIKLTKELAATNAKREAFKLAVEQCRFFAEQVVPTRSALIGIAKAKSIPYAPPGSFQISKGEIVALQTPGRDPRAEAVALSEEIVQFANRLEAFAMAFTTGVADELVAYRETANAFCITVPDLIAFIDQCRKNNLARYESIIDLYELWSNRLKTEALAKQKKALEKAEQHLKDNQPTKFKTIGSE